MRTAIRVIGRTALVLTGALAAPIALAQSDPPPNIKARIGPQAETCICNEDYTSCICCQTVATPPFVACDIVIEGKDVTGPVSVDLNLTTDGRGKVEVKRFQVQK
jgi:hypothetical protein